MGNLCSIFHLKFKNLIKIIPCARKAQLMDYILMGWQKSTYKLKNSDKKWFMKDHEEIAEELQIKVSTLRGYLKEFEERGFIERRRARYNRKAHDGQYHVTIGGYIYVTETFLNLLKLDTNNQSNTKETNPPKTTPKEEIIDTQSSFNDLIQRINSLKSGESYIRDLRTLFNNNINFKQTLSSVDKQTLERLITQFKSIQNYLANEVKEEIPEPVKKLILGTFFNLTFQHKIQLSSPTQVVAEYLFSLINIEFVLPKVQCFINRNNILAKILRSKNWRTPKGFYKYFYLGQNFKDKQELREKQRIEEKENELNQNTALWEFEDERLTRVINKMNDTNDLIEQLTACIYQESSEELICKYRERIEQLKIEREQLWQQQSLIEQQIERERILKECA